MSVEARVESLVAALQDNSEHWKPRLAALEELHDIAERARPTPDDLSKEVFAMLRVPMKQQLTDLRSQIVRLACTVTTRLAAVAGHRSRAFLSYVMPTLISISAGANKVMAGFALECTRDVVAAVQVHKIIAPLCELCASSKNKAVVESAIGCIHVALSKWDTFRRNDVSLIVGAVETCLGAASPNARATARKAFWSLQRLYPDRAERVFKGLDTRTQNLISEADPAGAAQEDGVESEDGEEEGLSSSQSRGSRRLSGSSIGSSATGFDARDDSDHGTVSSDSNDGKLSVDTGAAPVAAPASPNRALSRSPRRSPRRNGHSPKSPRPAEVIPYDLNDRVLVTDQHLPAFVRFVGTTEFASGIWIGCELIGKQTGKNSGEVKGVRYFECRENKGLFVRNGNLIFDDDPISVEELDAAGGEEESGDDATASDDGESQEGMNAVATVAAVESVAADMPPAPSVKKPTDMPAPSTTGSASPPVMSGDANGVAVELLNAHRAHVDGVLECLRGEMEKLAEFEAHGDGSAHRVAEYASCIAESMHKREQMLESMYQRLGALCASLAQAE